MKDRFKQIANRIKSFTTIYGWIFRKAILSQRKLTLWVLFASGVGAVAQGGLIGLLAFFTKFLETGTGTGIDSIDSILNQYIGKNLITVLVLTGGAFFMTSLSAYVKYISEVKSRELGRKHHMRCQERVLQVIGQAPSSVMTEVFGAIPLRIKLMMQYSTLAGKTAEFTVALALPVCYTLMALLLLVKLNLFLTLIILPLYGLTIPFLYRRIQNIQQVSRQYFDTSSVNMARSSERTLEYFNKEYIPVINDVSGQYLRDYHFDKKEVKEFFQIYDEFQLISEKASLLTLQIQAFMVSAVLLLLGIELVRGNIVWGTLVGYIMALRVLSAQISVVFGRFSTLNQYYPAIKNFYTFYEIGLPRIQTVKNNGQLPREITIKSTGSLGGDRPEIQLKTGKRMLFATVTKLNRINYGDLVRPLAQSSTIPITKWAGIPIITSLSTYIPAPLYVNLGLSSTGTIPHELSTFLKDNHIQETINRLPHGIETVVDEAVWLDFPEETRLAMKITQLQLCRSNYAFIHFSVFEKVEVGISITALEQISDKIVIIVTNKPECPAELFDYAAVAYEDTIAAVGSPKWFNSATDVIGSVLIKKDEGGSDEDDVEAVLA